MKPADTADAARWERLRLAAPETRVPDDAAFDMFVGYSIECAIQVCEVKADDEFEFRRIARATLDDRSDYCRLRYGGPLKNPGKAMHARLGALGHAVRDWMNDGPRSPRDAVAYEQALKDAYLAVERFLDRMVVGSILRSADCSIDVENRVYLKIDARPDYFCFAPNSLLQTTLRNTVRDHQRPTTEGVACPRCRLGETALPPISVDGPEAPRSLVDVADEVAGHADDARPDIKQVLLADRALGEPEDPERRRRELVQSFRQAVQSTEGLCPRHEATKDVCTEIGRALDVVMAARWDAVLGDDSATSADREQRPGLEAALEEYVTAVAGLSGRAVTPSERRKVHRTHGRCFRWLAYTGYAAVDGFDVGAYDERVEVGSPVGPATVGVHRELMLHPVRLRPDDRKLDSAEFPARAAKILYERYGDLRAVMDRQMPEVAAVVRARPAANRP